MEAAAWACHPHELADDALGKWNCVQHMTAHGQVERTIGRFETKNGLMLELRRGSNRL